MKQRSRWLSNTGIENGPNHSHIVTAKMGFHGRTFGAMSATGQPGNGCQGRIWTNDLWILIRTI